MQARREDLSARLESVRLRMTRAARRAGRDPDEVRLVVVTKGRSAQDVRAAYDLGLRTFGENRVQEARSKIEALSDLQGIDWHMIGHIQSRKARDVVGCFSLVHSVDRLRIANKLDAHAAEAGWRQPVLIECNVSGEAAKGGWPMAQEADWGRLAQELEALVALPNLEIRGLMTMAPWTRDRSVLEAVFGRLRRLSAYLTERTPGECWTELSMGMSDDFEVAIEQGATMIRLGRVLFGELTTKTRA